MFIYKAASRSGRCGGIHRAANPGNKFNSPQRLSFISHKVIAVLVSNGRRLWNVIVNTPEALKIYTKHKNLIKGLQNHMPSLL